MHQQDYYWGMPMMWFIWIPIFIIIIFVIMKMNNNRRNTPSEDSSLDILKNRYAKGEITKEQFEEMKQTLNTKN
ncbi:MAG: SHOCT domain-containing protein [Lutibacter sp.]|jgi:putative membrane protein